MCDPGIVEQATSCRDGLNKLVAAAKSKESTLNKTVGIPGIAIH
jgi:hypothetical protein